MKIRQQNIAPIAILLIVTLSALMYLQYFFLASAIQLKEQTYRRNVLSTMKFVADRLQEAEAVRQTLNTAESDLVNGEPTTITIKGREKELYASFITNLIPQFSVRDKRTPVWVEHNMIRFNLTRSQHVNIMAFNTLGKLDTVLVDLNKTSGIDSLQLPGEKYITGKYYFKVSLDSASYTIPVVNGEGEKILYLVAGGERKMEYVKKIMENLSGAEQEPIEKRIQPAMLDSLLKQQFSECGITIPYAFGVQSDNSDSLKFVQPAGYHRELLTSEFKSRLFPGDLFQQKHLLVLYFPGQNFFLIKQMAPLLVLTILLTVILASSFIYALRTIKHQKEFAGRIMDFINNMTHEFKTPISTISVATEMILKPEILERKEKIARYGSVINDEILRMKMQVDKILQMAILEQGDYELKFAPVDLHSVIAKAVGTFMLQVEAKRGKLEYMFNAKRSMINADIVHITNVIHNVLDNANKYSPESPQILITTEENNNAIVVHVEDHGIGMRRDEVKKVFDKYYRVPTGNRHDVKGFGLGLSYVKLMMTAHRGTAHLESDINKGTIITLSFPLMNTL